MKHPRMGERVRVRPTNPRVPVQRGARLYGQFLPPEGQEVLWDEFLHQRLLEGSITWAPIAAADPPSGEEASPPPPAAAGPAPPAAAPAPAEPAAASSADAAEHAPSQPKEPS